MRAVTCERPNVIFLDIDGVLCSPRACVAVGNDGRDSYLDPIACSLVKRLCVENNAKLVISSSWRSIYNKMAFQAILDAACPGLGDLLWEDKLWWKTSSFVVANEWLETSDRGREVINWVENNCTQFNNFAVLDDMTDMRPVQDSLVRCSTYAGMWLGQYGEVGRILKHRLGD